MGLFDTNPDRYLPRSDGSLNVVDHETVAARAGRIFHATHKVTHNATAASSATILMVTPATPQYHIGMGVESSKSGVWTLEEAASATSGTTLTALNMNRSNASTCTITITHTPTLTATAGTIMEQHLIGASAGNPTAAIGGEHGHGPQSWELNASTSYLLRFIADAATTITVMNIQLEKEV